MRKRKYGWWLAAVCGLSLMAAGAAAAGNLVLKGSTTVLPIAQKVAEEFMKENQDVRVSIAGGGSGNGIKALIDGTCDVAKSSRFIKKPEVELAVGRGVYPVPFCIAYDCIVPVVHPSNTVANLTVEQLKAIYRGGVRNWKEVGGPDREIVVVSRDTSSGTYEVWEEMVLGGDKVYPGALLQASNGAIVQTVAKNKNAVGYIGIGYSNPEVKPLSVNGIVGSEQTTLDGTYPISRPLFMFTPGWPKSEAQRFLNYFMHPEKGQKLVREAGFVPLYLAPGN
ncbi:MAG: phosphate ABC transporter substrate-binding protein [Desulfobacterales bacterium]|nr:phosphate ABC transporter substrate-binding protein [Desulfobacterales bacterium]